jgi:hypothetical protein
MSSSPSRRMKIGALCFAVPRGRASGSCSAFPAMGVFADPSIVEVRFHLKSICPR